MRALLGLLAALLIGGGLSLLVGALIWGALAICRAPTMGHEDPQAWSDWHDSHLGGQR